MSHGERIYRSKLPMLLSRIAIHLTSHTEQSHTVNHQRQTSNRFSNNLPQLQDLLEENGEDSLFLVEKR